MYKKYLLLSMFLIALSLTSCSRSTIENASPEKLYKQDNSIDLLVYNDIAFVNASDIDWVKDLELTGSEVIGKILRTNVTKGFEDFDATIIEVGTEVYSILERDDFVIVYWNDSWIPYYAYVEG